MKIKRAFLDALFPIHCCGCGREGAAACPSCLASLRIHPLNLCPGCGLVSPGGMAHARCRPDSALDGLVSPYHYADPFVRALIKEYKYRGAAEAGNALANLVHAGASALITALPRDAKVVPMPLHASRERMRGFNQAECLAASVARVLETPVARPLARKKRTREQARLEIGERQKNCKDAFASQPVDGDYILVDDVVTTGATMKAAALALKEAGARSVIGFALAHGSPHPSR